METRKRENQAGSWGGAEGEPVRLSLRMVPTTVIAHTGTFCASQDTPISYGCCLLIQGAKLRKSSWYPKKIGGTGNHTFFRDN